MNQVNGLLKERNIPELLRLNNGSPVNSISDFEKRQEEIKKLLQEKEYGIIPKKPEHLSVEVTRENNENCMAGKAIRRDLKFTATLDGKEFSFIATAVIPKLEGKIPAFVHINFNGQIPSPGQPTEEIIDRGYAVFSFDYREVTNDDKDFKDKCAPFLCRSRRAKSAPGKLAMWAWAAMRVMDYVQSLDCIDKEHIAVVGHSRLGKTALLCGGFDNRFKYVISNDSGCSGAALSRCNTGESISAITDVFPFWFCPAYAEASKNGDEFDFDQHFLLALTVPRHLIVNSADEDLWADPRNEFLSLCAVNEAYELYGKRGLVHNGTVPSAKAYLGDGDSCYHIRHGKHYLSREDWNAFMDYIDAQRAKG